MDIRQQAEEIFLQLENSGKDMIQLETKTKRLGSSVICQLKVKENGIGLKFFKVNVIHRGQSYNGGYGNKNVAVTRLCDFLSGMYSNCEESKWY